MYPLIMCSLVALGIILAKLWTLTIAHFSSVKLLEDLKDESLEGRINAVIETAESTKGPVAAILAHGLHRVRVRTEDDRGKGGADIMRAINTAGVIELDFLERGMPVLRTVSNVAPMLGFLGTVVGMILAFQQIESSGQVDPAMVAAGIKVALITTATGLAVAIPVNVAYNYFVSRIDRLILDMEEGAQAILRLIWGLDVPPRKVA